MQFGFLGIGSTFATFGRILCFGFLLQLVFTYFQCLAYGFFLLGSECIAKLYAQRIGYLFAQFVGSFFQSEFLALLLHQLPLFQLFFGKQAVRTAEALFPYRIVDGVDAFAHLIYLLIKCLAGEVAYLYTAVHRFLILAACRHEPVNESHA